jgi:hypothetical protein
MTITSTQNRVTYAGNGAPGVPGTTVFAVPFRFLAPGDLVVLVRVDATGVDTTKTLDSDYSVAGEGAATGGTVTFLIEDGEPQTGETLIVYGNPAMTQLVDYISGGTFPAESHEEALDRLTLQSTRTREIATRSLALTEGSTDGSGEYNANSNRISGMSAPTADTDATTKTYVDALVNTTIGPIPSGDAYVTATGSVTSRKLADRWGEVKNVKDFGVVANGVADDTAPINAAFTAATAAGGATVLIPAGSYAVGTLLVPSDCKVDFEPGVILVANATRVSADQPVIKVSNASRVEINGNGVIIRYPGTAGPIGIRYGVRLFGGTDVTIQGVRVENVPGDGFTLSPASTAIADQGVRVVFRDCVAYECYRNGWSIWTAKEVTLERCTGDRTGMHSAMGGTDPKAGFDFELHDFAGQEGVVFEGLMVKDCVARNNVNAGFTCFGQAWRTGMPLVNITWDGCLSEGNDQDSLGRYSDTVAAGMGGRVLIKNHTSINPKHNGLAILEWSSAGIPIIVQNLTVRNCNTNGSAGHAYRNALSFYRDTDGSSTHLIGNLHASGVYAYDPNASYAMRRAVYAADLKVGGAGVVNITVQNVQSVWDDATPPSPSVQGATFSTNVTGTNALGFGEAGVVATGDTVSRTLADRFGTGFTTLPAATAIVPISGIHHAITADTGTLTNFSGALDGHVLTLVAHHSMVVSDNFFIYLKNSVQFNMVPKDTLTLIYSQHNGGGYAWHEVSRSTQTAAAAYTATNVSTDRAYDANATTTAELADVLGTLIADLRAQGIVT